MSPVSRSRKPKRPAKQAHHAPASPFARYVDEAKALLEPEAEVTEAELWGSFVLGSLFEAAWAGLREGRADDPDEVFEQDVEGLVAYLGKQKRRPEALAGLRALAMVGEEWSRDLARNAADDLAESGVKEPAWLKRAFEVEPTTVFRAGDLFGDAGTLNVGFRRGEDEHVVSCYVADRGGAVLERVLVVPGSAAQLAEQMRAAEAEQDEDVLHFTEPSLVEVRLLLEEAVDRLLSEGPDDPEELAEIAAEAGLDLEELEMTSPTGLWALLATRLEALPEPELTETAVGSAEDVRETVAEFARSPQAAALVDREFGEALVTVFADVAAQSDRTAAGFGPISLGNYLLLDFPDTIELTEVEAAELPAVLTAWAEFTNERRGLGEEGMKIWRQALPQIIAGFQEDYFDEDYVELRRENEAVPVHEYTILAGLDLSEALEQILEEARAGEALEDADDEAED